MTDGERMIQANGVDLCVQTFGDPTDPAILLIHGASASMLWWDEPLCARLAAAGRFVIRFDNRDTGRSVSYPAGRPGYAMRDLAADAIGILDALGVARAHVVGCSMAGAIAAVLAVEHAPRVASVAFLSTTSGAPGLPAMSAEFVAYGAGGGPDLTDAGAVVEYVVGLARVMAGGSRYFDEAATRALVERDVARTRDTAACLTNHFLMEFGAPAALGDVAVPALVVHGALDPVFPPAHGESLAAAVPGARLVVLEGVGHELPAAAWDVFVPALVAATGG
jgi:pimeloyl-ACP methyl ester carboxylesterase